VSANTALLVIDVQNFFFHEMRPIYIGEEVVSKIKALISKARVSGVPVIYIQHLVGDKSGIQIDGTPLGAIHQAIAPTENDLVICKTTPDSFLGTNLDEVLKEMGIKKLIVTGFQTEFCVDTTCRRAFSLGYQVVLAGDAHSTYDNPVLSAEQIRLQLAYIYSFNPDWFAEVVRSENILDSM